MKLQFHTGVNSPFTGLEFYKSLNGLRHALGDAEGLWDYKGPNGAESSYWSHTVANWPELCTASDLAYGIVSKRLAIGNNSWQVSYLHEMYYLDDTSRVEQLAITMPSMKPERAMGVQYATDTNSPVRYWVKPLGMATHGVMPPVAHAAKIREPRSLTSLARGKMNVRELRGQPRNLLDNYEEELENSSINSALFDEPPFETLFESIVANDYRMNWDDDENLSVTVSSGIDIHDLDQFDNLNVEDDAEEQAFIQAAVESEPILVSGIDNSFILPSSRFGDID